MTFLPRLRAAIAVLAAGVLLSGCLFHGGEAVNSTSPVVRTSIMPASVPYYLDPCGQNGESAEYRLYAPAGLRLWLEGKDGAGSEGVDAPHNQDRAARHERCAGQLKIENGDAITVRLHRVGLGGLARFDAAQNGKCISGCRRDIAVVIEFNGSATLQRPIVAFYQTDVPPDGLLQFTNQTIFTQDEWFFRFPPNVRVRLYDVRDDKDAALRANLETVKRGVNQVKAYISGAAIAGPIVDTAFRAADQLLSKPRNRAILDMSFQLFPQLNSNSIKPGAFPGNPCEVTANSLDVAGIQISAVELKRQTQLCEYGRARAAAESRFAVPEDAVKEFQRRQKLDADGVIGPKTQARLNGLGLKGSKEQLKQQLVRTLVDDAAGTAVPQRVADDATFGAPIYASQYIVFNEAAYGLVRPEKATTGQPMLCNGDGTIDPISRDNRRRLIGAPLPKFYFVPDGVNYMGARVHARFAREQGSTAGIDCVLESPFVVFSITRESSAVSLDVAQRISDLGNKFTVTPTVSESVIATLSSTLTDAELALAIDRLENRQRGAEFYKMVKTLDDQLKRASLPSTTGQGGKNAEAADVAHPKPGPDYRSRVYRLINDYTGCVVTDDDAATRLAPIANQWKSVERQKQKRDGAVKPYFDAVPTDCKVPATPASEEAPPAALAAGDSPR